MKKTVALMIIILLSLLAFVASGFKLLEMKENEPKIEILSKPYTKNDLYGYWLNVNNTSKMKIVKLMYLDKNGQAIDSAMIQSDDRKEEIKQRSLWLYDPKTNIFTQKVIKIVSIINGKIEEKKFDNSANIRGTITLKTRGNDTFLEIVYDDGTIENYQKLTESMQKEIRQKAEEKAQ